MIGWYLYGYVVKQLDCFVHGPRHMTQDILSNISHYQHLIAERLFIQAAYLFQTI